jgi:PAS domain S-box-containing protein
LALNAAALGVWSWDIPRGRIRLSEQVGRLLPATPTAEVDYKEVLAIVHPEDRERIEAARQQAIRTGKEYELEYRILQRDGTARWIASRGSCTYDTEGAPLRMTGVSHDITERKRSELALRESERRFWQMADAAPVMVWMAGEDKGCTYFNERWLDFTGRTMEEERGDGWAAGVHPEDRERCLTTYTRAFDLRQEFELEYRLRRRDGEYRWLLDIGVPRVEGDGRFAGYIGSCIDITERRRAEEALRASEAVTGGILTSLAGHMAILDRNGGIVRVNEAWDQFALENGAEALAGISVGANYLEVCRRATRGSEPSAQVALEGIEAVLAGAAEEFTLEYPCHAPAEERWFVMRVTPLKRPEGGAVISHVNITARKVAELEAEGVRRELAHATRVMLMGELTASLAHELNQPLTAIVSNAQAGERFLAGPAPPLEDVREILEDVVADATRAGEVIRQIRGLVKKGVGEFVTLDLNWVIQEVVVLARTDAIVRKVAIVLELAPSLPPVRGDKTQLQQVLLNLILNGLEAMEARGADERTLVIRTVCEDAATVRVGVQDSGPGIPEEGLTRIFEPFYTTKATGMGMGLSLTRSIIDAHGGTIWAENNPKRGATFWFSLPANHDPAP